MKFLYLKLVLFTGFLLGSWASRAQFGLPQANLSDDRPTEFLLNNVNVVVQPGTILSQASVYVKDGKIAAIGTSVKVASSFRTIDGKGFWVYPSFIDLFGSYGLTSNTPGPQIGGGPPRMVFQGPQYESKKPGSALWNMALKPEFQAVSQFAPQEKEAEEWRKNGFGWVVSCSQDGIMRGTGALVSTDDGTPNTSILKPTVVQGFSFQKGSSPQDYPSSQMGAIALIRQTLLDQQWYRKSKNRSQNLGLEALISNQNLPILFETQQKYEMLRAAQLGKEFGLRLILKGKGDEYQRLEEIKNSGFPVIIPLQFPELPDVEDPLDAGIVSLSDLKHWDLAPSNAALLSKRGIPFAFTLKDLKDPKSFLVQWRKVLETGLPETEALAALTSNPARFLGLENEIGSLQVGRQASFFISTLPISKPNAQIVVHYIKGKRFEMATSPETQWAGTYRLKIGSDSSLKLKVEWKESKPEFTILEKDTQKIATQGSISQGKVLFLAQIKKLDSTAKLQFTGWEWNGNFRGWVPIGLERVNWEASRILIADTSKKDKVEKSDKKEKPGAVWYPFQAFGQEELPKPMDFVIRNATLWTNEKEGIMDKADLYVANGKIKGVGKNLTVPAGTKEWDATGKHVTTGIIDEHSHIAISRGVNEGSSTTSSEVRIGDVIEADDINIYRHLAGGVTTVQQLHGSANTIGGQSSLIKLKWGFAPEQMKQTWAAPFNKFALGENVKQSNWGANFSSRYPQTRMGVEQLLFDAFHRARQYREEEKKLISSKSPEPFRRDLKLEALAEIMEGKRFITCHSYVQSEINMLMHVADSMKFRVNTFTHILEGYKVADKMKKHGAGASTFSDWWAYKMEVKDAIPWNAALMHRAGLVVAINSDDAEMARRLNQEAGKVIKYGGISEADAWKMVTLNPAKLLHLDQRLGSMVAGKDADLVMWSANPLSIEAKAEKTFIDGILFFDLEKNKALERQNEAERQRIIQKMLQAKKEGQPASAPQPRGKRLWHCDDLGEE